MKPYSCRWRTFVVGLIFTCCSPAEPAMGLADPLATADAIAIAIFEEATPSAQYDVNLDQQISAADIVALYRGPMGPTPTPTEMPSATPTAPPSPSPTATATPTVNGLLFAGTISNLAPYGVGDTLVYRVVDQNDVTTMETVTVSATNGPGKYIVDVVSGTKMQTRTQSDLGTRLFLVSTYDRDNRTLTSCQPGILELATPLVVDQPYTSSVVCSIQLDGGMFLGTFRRDETSTPKGLIQVITVPAGTYANAIDIQSTVTLSGASTGTESHDSYLVPGVGVVRHTVVSGRKRTTRELVDGTIGGQSVRR